MKFHLSSSDHPIIMILMVLLMNPELKLSTIRITTGLTVYETRSGLLKLIENGIIDKISVSSRNPTFQLIDSEKAKSYLEELAKQKIAQF
ncbi:MAG: hypothetical protein GPJ54_07495 [Candidatus Heimdallarchaeota archaeon]|nr:hypothetical protein [Candidatus Heimdallarchaeota archaeon]